MLYDSLEGSLFLAGLKDGVVCSAAVRKVSACSMYVIKVIQWKSEVKFPQGLPAMQAGERRWILLSVSPKLFLWPVTHSCCESAMCSFPFTTLHFVLQHGSLRSSTACGTSGSDGLWNYIIEGINNLWHAL